MSFNLDDSSNIQQSSDIDPESGGVSESGYVSESGITTDSREHEFLRNYDVNLYERPSVSVDILVFTTTLAGELKLLLLRRKELPFAGYWALPGGFISMEESLEETAARKLKEKVNVEDIYLEQLYTFGSVKRDPRTRVISVAYLALVPRGKLQDLHAEAKDGAEEVCWADVTLDEKGLHLMVPPGSVGALAFDHEQIIQTAVERMRGKIGYTDLAFRFLNDPNRFAAYELQKIFESIEGHKLDTPNFRRMFLQTYVARGLAEATGEECREFSRRASQYYRWKESAK